MLKLKEMIDVIKNVRVDEFTTECVKNVKFQIFFNIVISDVGTEEALNVQRM